MRNTTTTELKLADRPVLDSTDFDYPEHAPRWVPAGSARICGVCGALDLPALGAPDGTRRQGMSPLAPDGAPGRAGELTLAAVALPGVSNPEPV